MSVREDKEQIDAEKRSMDKAIDLVNTFPSHEVLRICYPGFRGETEVKLHDADYNEKVKRVFNVYMDYERVLMKQKLT